MRCPRCEAENPGSAKFCSDCGVRLDAPCPSCGHTNAPGARFCNECGQALDQPPAPMYRAAAEPLASYTPKHLAERVLSYRSALEGERKQVTVLFVDIVESSRLAEQLDPEVMHRLMDRTLRLMAETVHRYEGTVNQFLGDGLMALFGAPLALEDHASRAVQAALTIRETVGGYSEQLKHEQGVEIRLRLGLNSGLVVVGKIGDDLRMDYTAIGDTTNLAARMQALADPGTILITDATHRLVSDHVRTESLGPVLVKGRSAPVPAFKVIGRQRRRSRLEIGADLGLTGLVGRQRELTVLGDCFARVKGGRGHVVGIVGEPGVGKSRLLYEFRKSLEGEHVTWLEGHCAAYGQTMPYLPLLEMWKANFNIDDDDNPLQVDQKLRQGLHQLDPDLMGTLPSSASCWARPARTRPCVTSIPRTSASGPSTRCGGSCLPEARPAPWSSSSRICTGSTDRPKTIWPSPSRASPPCRRCCSRPAAPGTRRAGRTRRTTRKSPSTSSASARWRRCSSACSACPRCLRTSCASCGRRRRATPCSSRRSSARFGSTGSGRCVTAHSPGPRWARSSSRAPCRTSFAPGWIDSTTGSSARRRRPP